MGERPKRTAGASLTADAATKGLQGHSAAEQKARKLEVQEDHGWTLETILLAFRACLVDNTTRTCRLSDESPKISKDGEGKRLM